jgi:hypothetical protein
MAEPQSNAALPAFLAPAPPSVPAPPLLPELPPGAPRAGVLHVRHRHTERYTVVGNHLAQHASLSATAIGVGVHIQSLPDGASVTVKALTLRFPEGETTIGKALRELETAGYLVRRRVPLGRGRIATRTFFFDHPGAVVVRVFERGSGGGAVAPVPARVPLPAAVPAPVVVPVPVAAAVDVALEEPPVVSSASEALPVSAPAPVPVAVVESAGAAQPGPVSASGSTRQVGPESGTGPGPAGPAADLLARLRLADPRLLLSERDVQRLVPAVETWLARSATPDQIARTLTTSLPSQAVPIHHPARLLEYRLATLLPPPLPTAPAGTATTPSRPQPLPLVSCDDCERAVRSHDSVPLCRECRERRAGGTEAIRPAA